jgi:DNA-binding GntR family transcriptional regulator
MEPETKPSSLQTQMAKEILAWVCDQQYRAGRHLPEQEIAAQFGLSRSPVRGALLVLAERGILEQRANRGFFLLADADTLALHKDALPDSSDDVIYEELAKAWFTGNLPEQVTEAELRRTFNYGRARISRAMRRLASDGIISAAAGNGWRLEPSLSTEAAFEESYSFRRIIETAAILSPTFRLNMQVADRVRRRHLAVLAEPPAAQRLKVFVDVDIEFHDMIGVAGGNQFIAQAIQRQNAMRRLTEHQSNLGSGRLHDSCREHLGILDALELGENARAAALMGDHLTISSRFRPIFAG